MSFAPNRIVRTPNQSTRNGVKPEYIVHHHFAGTSFESVIESWRTGRKQGSAHRAFDNFGGCTEVVPDHLRAWSLSSAHFDSLSLVTETVNLSARGWTISDAAFEAMAQSDAQWSAQHGIPLDRAHVIGHSEVKTIHGYGYATACPGEMLTPGSPHHLDRMVERSRAIQDGAGFVVVGGSAAASTPSSAPQVSGGAWAVNLPDAGRQRRVQKALAGRNPSRYTGPQDGVFGVNTWKGIQTSIRGVGYTGPVDGVPGANTCRLVQVYAQKFGDYRGPVDSILGPNSYDGLALGLERP